jgi:hypothetical protein
MKDGVLPTAGVLNYCHCASDLFLVCISPYANEIDGFPQPVSLFTDQISSRNRFGSFSRLLVATETARLAVHRHTRMAALQSPPWQRSRGLGWAIDMVDRKTRRGSIWV